MLAALAVSFVVHGGLLAMTHFNRLISPADIRPAEFTVGDESGDGEILRVQIDWPVSSETDTGTAAAPALSPTASATPSWAGLPANEISLPAVIAVDDEVGRTARHLRQTVAASAPGIPLMMTTSGTGAGGLESGTATGTSEGGVSSSGKPAYLRNPQPKYPRVARENGWEGTTVLRVLVMRDGRGGKIEVVQSSGFPVLDETSVETVRHWRFLPARQGAEPVDSWVEIPFRFQLLNG